MINSGFFIQIFAVGIGVFGGMWADKKLQEHDAIRKIIGTLEVIDAEMQSNIKAVMDINDVINTRPSYMDRSKYSSNKIIEMAQNEEKFIIDISKQIVDKGYYEVLTILSTLENRKLFEKIVNTYLKLRNTQLVLGLVVLDSFTGVTDYSNEQKYEAIKMGDQHFYKLSEGLTVLKEHFLTTDKDIIEEEKKLLNRIKRF